jgi:hypothetical protein
VPCSLRPTRSGFTAVFRRVTIECIREKEAHRRIPSKLCTQRPGIRLDPGLFLCVSCSTQSASRPAAALQRSTGSHTGNGDRSFKTSCDTHTTTGWLVVSQTCGCSSAGRARPRHGRGHEFDSRYPLQRFTSGVSLHSVAALAWCWRPGCARPELGSRAARHLIRRDARAWAQPK